MWELGIAWWRCFVARGGHPIGCTITDRAAAAKAGDTYLPGRSERCSLPTEGQEPDVSTDGAPRFALARALEARRRDGINRALTGFPYVTGTQRSCTLQVAASSLSLSLPPVSPLLSSPASRVLGGRRGGVGKSPFMAGLCDRKQGAQRVARPAPNGGRGFVFA